MFTFVKLFFAHLDKFFAMEQFLMTLGMTLGFLGLCFVGLNISYFVKGREFRGTCSQNNPLLKEKIGECGICGKKSDEACKMPEVH